LLLGPLQSALAKVFTALANGRQGSRAHRKLIELLFNPSNRIQFPTNPGLSNPSWLASQGAKIVCAFKDFRREIRVKLLKRAVESPVVAMTTREGLKKSCISG
jgi:hypothetical protein